MTEEELNIALRSIRKSQRMRPLKNRFKEVFEELKPTTYHINLWIIGENKKVGDILSKKKLAVNYYEFIKFCKYTGLNPVEIKYFRQLLLDWMVMYGEDRLNESKKINN